MELRDLQKKAEEIAATYRERSKRGGHAPWGTAEYAQGFVGDVGDLMKLIMAKNHLRDVEDVDRKLAHELADCLWSVIIIAKELDINLEQAFLQTMQELEKRIGNE